MEKTCRFCAIVRREAAAEIVYEDERILAFRDIHPQAPVHILIIPKKHIEGIREAEEEDAELLGHMLLCARNIAKKESVLRCGFRVVVNQGPDAGQAIFHIHAHLLGGRTLRWPPG